MVHRQIQEVLAVPLALAVLEGLRGPWSRQVQWVPSHRLDQPVRGIRRALWLL